VSSLSRANPPFWDLEQNAEKGMLGGADSVGTAEEIASCASSAAAA